MSFLTTRLRALWPRLMPDTGHDDLIHHADTPSVALQPLASVLALLAADLDAQGWETAQITRMHGVVTVSGCVTLADPIPLLAAALQMAVERRIAAERVVAGRMSSAGQGSWI